MFEKFLTSNLYFMYKIATMVIKGATAKLR